MGKGKLVCCIGCGKDTRNWNKICCRCRSEQEVVTKADAREGVKDEKIFLSLSEAMEKGEASEKMYLDSFTRSIWEQRR